ncbi:MAG: hypothetical protein PHU21_09110 [Elusimicrobia bacterium]|nr:hypothetical protein [Elusimicrobiota bacterium]
MNATAGGRRDWAAPADSPRAAALRQLVRKMRELVAAKKLEAAFSLGDRIMAARPPAEIVEGIMYPVDRGLVTFPDSSLYDLLQAVLKRPDRGAFRAWKILLTTVILDRLRWTAEALRESDRLAGLPRRYGWMRWHRGLLLLNNRWDCAEAAADLRAVLESAPQVWKARALLAEIALVKGAPTRAFAEMDALLDSVPPEDRGSVLAWRGEMRLWLGSYRKALRDLDEAAACRSSALALCWRGAAHLKLGHFPEALRDLDAQLQAHAEDQEALVWRGEALRLCGRRQEALADLDAAVRFGNSPLWAYIDRALVRARLGDVRGMWSDYLLVPEWVRSYFSWKLGADVKPDSPARAVTAQLEAILKAGRGVRRNDQYLTSLWVEPLTSVRPDKPR